MHILKRIGFWLFIGGILFAIFPILSVLAASGLSTIGGCELNEGDVNACSVLGIEMGGLLYTMFVMGWFALVTLPYGGLVAVIGLILYVIAKIVLRRRKNRVNEPQVPGVSAH